MKSLTILLVLLSLLVGEQKRRYSDTQLQTATSHYFQRHHQAPQLLGVSVYSTREGRVYQVEIQGERSRASEDLDFAFRALATLGQHARRPFKQFIVVLHWDLRGKIPTVCVARARCSLDTFVRRRIDYREWWQRCVHFREL